MKWNWLTGLVAVAAALATVVAPAAPPKTELPPQVAAAIKSLKPQHGKIALPDAKATLDIGTSYDFYGPEDARKILVQIWGNPPENADGVLGLVMPAGNSPLGDAWGAVVTFEDTGYVSDSDASEADYDELLEQMLDGEDELNQERKSAGYPAIHLAGWADRPRYDPATHSVVWARDLAFSDSQMHTLNYDLRTLGRRGVLSLNFVSTMPRLAEIKAAAGQFASHASFDPGARYADFDPSADRKAEYGIAGLVAAGVGVAAAKKLGLLALLLKFIKPILIGVAVLFGALRNRIMGLFNRQKDPLEGE